MSLYYEILIVVLSFISAVTSAFQLFTCKLCLQFSGLRMRNFTWNRFPIKHLLIDSLLTPIVESTYLNRDMCKFESSQKDESRWQSIDSSKAYRNTSAFKCRTAVVSTYFLTLLLRTIATLQSLYGQWQLFWDSETVCGQTTAFFEEHCMEIHSTSILSPFGKY